MNGYAIYLLIVAFGVGYYLADTGYFIYFKFRFTQTIIVGTALTLSIISPNREWPVIVVASVYFLIRLFLEFVLGIVNLSEKKEAENDKEV